MQLLVSFSLSISKIVEIVFSLKFPSSSFEKCIFYRWIFRGSHCLARLSANLCSNCLPRACVCVGGYLDVRWSPSTSRDGHSRRDRKRVVSAFSDYSAICTDSIQVFLYHGLPVEFMWFLKRSYLIFVCEVCLSFLRLHSTVWLGLCSLITGEGEQTSPWKS